MAVLDGTSKPLTVYEDKLNYSGVQIGRNFIQEAADYNQQGGVAALQSVSATALTAKPIVEPKTTVKLSDEISETIGQLQAWYLKLRHRNAKRLRNGWSIKNKRKPAHAGFTLFSTALFIFLATTASTRVVTALFDGGGKFTVNIKPIVIFFEKSRALFKAKRFTLLLKKRFKVNKTSLGVAPFGSK